MNAELERLVRDEAEATRAADYPLGQGKRVNRGRSTVYSVRLTEEEVAAVQAAAERAQLPASTLVRSWIVERVRSMSSDDDARLRALIHEEVRAAVREALAS
ncbi:MAG TPA: hypothetical protein VG247_22930 [Pseudonocardiaceae bacterium]|jgi:hypothetical protein|nr:hypothetical protein [Pseudonocardiaceae bacterium]